MRRIADIIVDLSLRLTRIESRICEFAEISRLFFIFFFVFFYFIPGIVTNCHSA